MPCSSELRVAALGVAEIGVAAVDQHVALVEVRRDLLDHGISAWPAWTMLISTRGRASAPTHSLDRLLAGDRTLGAVLLEELLRAAGSAVVHDHGDLVMGNVASQVGAHRGQAGEAEVGVRGGGHADNLSLRHSRADKDGPSVHAPVTSSPDRGPRAWPVYADPGRPVDGRQRTSCRQRQQRSNDRTLAAGEPHRAALALRIGGERRARSA